MKGVRFGSLLLTGLGSVHLWAQASGDAAPVTPPTPAPPAAALTAPAPLSAPAMTGPLAMLPPAIFDAGLLGKLAVNGFISGMGQFQSNAVPRDATAHGALSNGQVVIQKTAGWFQFYLQAGAYDIPVLGVPFLSTERTLDAYWSPLPVGYAKLQAGKNTSILIGSLPSLIGAEYTFTFENMNVQRGLLWNQEPAISRGVQINQTMGKFAAAVSWNDGFYSDRYTWISGSLAYINGPHALSFVAGGNLGQTKYQTFSTPVQNNGSIYNLIYTYTKGAWIVQPYVQYADIPTNPSIGVVQGASTKGGAILLSYAFKHGFSLPVRFEYITSSSTPAKNAVSLLYGPGSAGTSFTATPTYQTGGFFVRGDLSFVHASSYAPGFVFGPRVTDDNQVRAEVEIGFVFGNNITEIRP